MTATPTATTDLALTAAQNSADRVTRWATAANCPLVADPDLIVARLGDRGFYTNAAIVLDPVAATADPGDLHARIAAVVPPGDPSLLVVPVPDAPSPEGPGWSLVGHPPFMVRQPSAAPAPLVPAELQIVEVVDQPGLEVFERTLVDAYPDPLLQPYTWGSFLHEAFLGGPTRFWLGLVGGRPVATAWSTDARGITQVDAVSTMPGDRGRGYGAAVTWAATTATPDQTAVLISSDLGRGVYEGLGFTPEPRWTLYLRH